jgi:O-succinylbenzoic acid--CoA ligase
MILSFYDFIPKDFDDRPLFILKGAKVSYKEACKLIEEKSRALSCYGSLAGKAVAFDATATIETVIAMFSFLKLGASCLLLNHRLPYSEKNLLAKRCSAYLSIIDAKLTIHEESRKIYSKPYLLIATSGSTKEPKIAALSCEQIYYSALGSNVTLGLCIKDCLAMTLPLHHVGGILPLFRALLARASLLFGYGEPLTSILRASSVASIVPTQLYRLLQEDSLDYPSLKALIVGGAAASTPLINKAVERGLPIMTTYGMTESCSMITLEKKQPEKSSGTPLPFREIAISDEGEILIRGKTLFSGYVEDGAILPSVSEDGWFATKDTGHIDSSGRLHVLGRKDLMFICGGENIHPEKIEKHILDLPDVIAAAVCPIEDMEWGQRPVAFVAFDKETISIDTLRERLQKHLPSYALPVKLYPLQEKHYVFGKLSRQRLLATLTTKASS